MADAVRVLYVDDEPGLLELVRTYLEGSGGFSVDTVRSAPAALAVLRGRTYDAIVSDFQMPEMDGMAFLQSVRASGTTVPFIFFTGRSSEEVAIDAINNGADFYLRKGSEPEALFAELKQRILDAVRQKKTRTAPAGTGEGTGGKDDAPDRAAPEGELLPNNGEAGRTEEMYRDSGMLFRTLVELSLEGIFITDFTGKLLFANRAAGMIVDVADFAPLIGKKNVMDFVDRESKAAVLRDLGKVFLGIDAYLVHYKLVTATKREVWVELIGKKIPFRDSSAVLISMRDVTERKLAEEQVRESHQKFATVFQSSPVALTLASATDGTFVDVNDSYVAGTGYSRNEAIGRTAEELGIFPDRDAYGHFVALLRKHRVVKGIELKCRVKSGEVRTCSFSSAIIRMGRNSQILSSIEDITERKATETALRESEEKYRSLVETTPDIIWETDRQGIIRYVSPQVREVMGYTPEEITGRTLIDLVPEKHRPRMKEELGRLPSGRELQPFEVPAIHRDRHTLILEIRPAQTVSGGTQGGFRGMAVDITERRRDEDALRQANRKLNLLSGITRHDIMNKLMALDGYVTLLHNRIPDPSDNPYFSRITTASSQIANLIQFTGEYQKVGVHAPAWQDIRNLVDAAGRDTAPGRVTLQNDLPAGTEVFADPLIAKVFFNLIDNAVRHGGRITTVRFSCEERDADRVIVCADDGDGIPVQDKERIFERGFGKNTGFGLALSREILDITGITIAETGEAGSGARFEIAVPKDQYRTRA